MTASRCVRIGQAVVIPTILLLISFPYKQTTAYQDRGPAPAGLHRPRLVLVIVADQFRYDYLDRFGDLFGMNGLKRLMRDGASWIDANYDQVPTYTAPSHATIMTGAYPALTGIVANEWPDRETGKKVSSVSDADGTLFAGGAAEEASSPRRLMTSTVGDELRLATNDRSKVIGISVKDRAAILTAGRHANAAYWISQQTGSIVSSNYYFSQLPGWVTKFNATRPEDKYFGAKWERLLAEQEYLRGAGSDSPAWEKVKSATDTNSFPHVITGGLTAPGEKFYEALDVSPFTSDILLAFAKEAITNEHLGADDDPDVLAISFSANDYVGHRYGPYSQEVMDVTLRFDRQLAELLEFVDARVGLGNTVVLFTADHGVAPAPEQAIAAGLSGGRIKASEVLAPIRAAISERFNPTSQLPDRTADYIYKYRDEREAKDALINGNLYFDRAALKRDGINLDELEQVACRAAMAVRGIARCYTRAQIEQGAIPDSDYIGRRVSHGFYSARSGDLVLITSPFYVISTETATHGSPYAYDTHVPLMLMGAGITAGQYLQPANPMDVAPTLSALLKVQPPSASSGRILREALQH